MKKLFVYLKPNLAKMCLGLTIKFLGTVMDLFLPWVLAYMIDNVAVKKDQRVIITFLDEFNTPKRNLKKFVGKVSKSDSELVEKAVTESRKVDKSEW